MKIIFWAVLAVLVLAGLVYSSKQKEECEKQGGVFVRSTWEFVCVEPLKVAPKK